jgi:hypothetical protein
MKQRLFECKSKYISEGLSYHIHNNVPLEENIYRPGSDMFFGLFREARRLYSEGTLTPKNENDIWFLENQIGEFGMYKGKPVLLDFPVLVTEAEYQGRDVELNSPQRSSGPKKYKVYVKNDKGNVIVVNFGDAKGGLTAKTNDPEARKAFADRHDCKNKKDKTKAGYWSCNLPRYGEKLGLKGGNFYW